MDIINRKTNSPPNNEGSLTKRASLTFISTLLQRSAQLSVHLLVTPILVRGLGAELFGSWKMIQQTVGYLGMSDLRPMGTVRFTLAVSQHRSDIQEKKRQIGAALIVWAATFPIFLLCGAAAVWAVPFFIRTNADHTWAVRMALGLMAFGVAFDKLLSLPANVLRGMNLDYKAMGLNALATLMPGAFLALAIWAGGGLPGVAIASVAGILLINVFRLLVARKVLPWFGAAQPTRNELFEFGKLSGWFFLAGISGLFLYGSDLLIIGIILGPSAAAIYGITGFLLRIIAGFIVEILRSANPGITGLCGKKDLVKVKEIRTEMQIIAISIFSIVGTIILIFNKSFIHLWVGSTFYAGDVINFLLVLIALLDLFFIIDGVIIEGFMKLMERSLILCSGGVITVIIGGILSYSYGYVGMALGALFGRLFISVAMYIYCSHLLKLTYNNCNYLLLPFLCLSFFFCVSYIISFYVNLSNWLLLIIYSFVSLVFCSSFFIYIGISKDFRSKIFNRFFLSISSLGYKNSL